VPPPTARDHDAALAQAQRLFFKRGLTAVADMGSSMQDWQAFRRAGDANQLYIRIMAYGDGIENTVQIGGPGPSPWLYADRLRLNGVKLYMDGALGSRGAWLKTPYHDKPETRGLPRLNQTQLGNLMSRAAMDNFQIAVHAIGDEANAVLLGAMEDLSATYKGDRRWRIEHAQVIDPADWPTMGRLAKTIGVIASMQPVHQTSDRLMAEARLGPDRLKGAYAWASLKHGRRPRVRISTHRSNCPTLGQALPLHSAVRTRPAHLRAAGNRRNASAARLRWRAIRQRRPMPALRKAALAASRPASAPISSSSTPIR